MGGENVSLNTAWIFWFEEETGHLFLCVVFWNLVWEMLYMTDRDASTNLKAPPLHLHIPLQVLLPVARFQAHIARYTKSTPSCSWNLRLLLSFMITDKRRQESRRGINVPYPTHKTGQQSTEFWADSLGTLPGYLAMTLRAEGLGEGRVDCNILLKEWTLFILITKLWVIINQQTPSLHMNHIYYSKPQVTLFHCEHSRCFFSSPWGTK